MPGDCSPELRETIENTIRFLAVDAVDAAASGHPGAPMGLAAAARIAAPQWSKEDMFVV